jgi:nucleoside-diphosphate-sugar epimerase
MSKLFLVGGTGGLGSEIAEGLVKAQGFEEKIAVVK